MADSQNAIGGEEVEPVEETATIINEIVQHITIGQPPIAVS